MTDLNELRVIIPGMRYGDKLDMEITRISLELALERRGGFEFEKQEIREALRRDALAESCPLIECGAANVREPHEAASPNPVTVAYLTEAIKRMSEEVRK